MVRIFVGDLDGRFVQYLLMDVFRYGVLLAKGKNEGEAIEWFIKSVHLYPWHWGAWLELSSLISSPEQVSL